MSYAERLNSLDLFFPERHRVPGDLIVIFKVPNRLTNLHTDQYFAPRPPKNESGHLWMFFAPQDWTTHCALTYVARLLNNCNKVQWGSFEDPILFLVVVNDLRVVLSQACLLFAVSTKNGGNTVQWADILVDLLAVNAWSEKKAML